MAKQKQQQAGKRAWIADIRVEFGTLSMLGNVYNPLKPNGGDNKKTEFHVACPTCANQAAVSGMSQRYICTVNDSHGPFEVAECKKYAYANGEAKLFDPEDITAAKASELPAKMMVLTAHPADDVLPYVVAAGKGRPFHPKGDFTFFSMLMEMLDESGRIETDGGTMVLMSETRFMSEEVLVILVKRNGQLVFQQIERPERVDTIVAPTTVPLDDAIIDLARQTVETAAEPYDKDKYRSKAEERYAELLAAGDNGPKLPKKKAPVKSSDDIVAQLQAAIASNVAKKVTA